LRAELALAFCTLLWGSTFVVVKNSLDDSSVFVFLALRFTLAGVCMAVFRPQLFRVLQREEIFAGVRLGFFTFCGYAFQTAGLRYTTAANSGFITGSSVLLVPLILALFWGKRVRSWVYFGTIAAAAGLYFLERLVLRSVAGAALVLAGILAAELFGPPAAPESPEPTGEKICPFLDANLQWSSFRTCLPLARLGGPAGAARNLSSTDARRKTGSAKATCSFSRRLERT